MWSAGCIFVEMHNREPLFPGDSEMCVWRDFGGNKKPLGGGAALRRARPAHYAPPLPSDQLFHIFRSLGTPDEGAWWGVTRMPNYVAEYPQWQPRSLEGIAPNLGGAGLSLLGSMLTYDPLRRATCRQVLEHEYFADLDFTKPENGRAKTAADALELPHPH